MIEPLKPRELDVLRLLAEGLTDREIAQRLSLSVNTVKWYNKQLFQKLDAENRTEAVAVARRLGLLSVDRIGRGPAETSIDPFTNLPSQVTSFVGRVREIQEIRRLLKSSRLVTITGPAGIGKTRLAQQVAQEASRAFPDGVCFVPLAPVSSAEDVPWTIAEHARVSFTASSPPYDQLLNHFQSLEILLLLDNFEHLLPGAETLAHLLQAAPDLKLLVTSRERLSVYGEMVYPLGGLPLSSSKTEQEAEAVQLFVQRAKAINPRLDPDSLAVARLCEMVDGSPLAIELAATWSDTLTPNQIAHELESSMDILRAEIRDLPSEKASMRAAIRRSWHLLDDEQRRAFRRLSAFRGGFTRESASTVAEVKLATLQELVKKSLAQYDPELSRYDMHELLRQYAREKLEDSGEATEVAQAHAAYFAEFMASSWPRFKGREQRTAVQDMEVEIENARLAWQYWILDKDWNELARLRDSFWVIHDVRGWYPAGLRWFGAAADAMRGDPSPEAKAGLGWMLAVQGLYMVAGGYNFMDGYSMAWEGVNILRSLALSEELFIPLICLVGSAVRAGKLEVASEAARECLEVAEEIDDPWSIAKAKQLLALRAMEGEQYDEAEALAAEALAVYESQGDRWSESVVCIEVLGMTMIRLKQLDEAQVWLQRGLAAAEEIEFEYAMQMAHWQSGYVAALREDYAEAGRHWEQALSIGDRVIGSVHLATFGGTISSGDWREQVRAENTPSREE